MRLKIAILAAMISAIFSPIAAETTKVVQLITIDDEINAKTWRIMRSGLEAATENDADIVVLRLNTYGGELSAADSMRTAILRFPKPTIAYVDNNAASAGALIALACDSVFMTPGASMGAATVVNGTDGTAMPDKYQSYMRAMMRSTAEGHGKRYDEEDSTWHWRRNPLVAEAMVDSRVVVAGLVDSTKVLTFTTNEAIEWGYADGVAATFDELLAKLDLANARVEEFEPAWSDHLIGFLGNKVFQGILISLILLGLYWEIQIPTSGFPILISIVSAILYFLPSVLEGEAFSPWAITLFAAGLILLALEILVVPGFGVTGIAGIVCVAGSLVWTLAENIHFGSPTGPTDGGESPSMAVAICEALGWFAGAVVVSIGVTAWLTSRHGPALARRHTELTHSQEVSEGYIGVDMSLTEKVGMKARTITPLRPSGKIAIEGDEKNRPLDAVAVSGFIEAGKEVEIIRYENAQLYVRLIEHNA